MYTITRGPSKLVTQRRTDRQQIESFTPAHEQNVRFVHDAWQEVVQSREEAQGAVRYEDSSPSPDMDNFVPIDLDEWWAQRFLANIDKLS
ncbi:hypothetical protein fugu_015544 [Takifugu bimaculatus]|uniref:MAPK regulated corepressor interacting protein 2 n=1 Tax=Takifugu bimaculatus TaxID=433685 RepID=A0A4Z2C086_9TELE|nr:hypothetical protein fugu_015544 [Takifugu bimaculatus]